MTTQGVTESKTGTMSDKDGQAKAAPAKEGKLPAGAKVSPETPKFTQTEYNGGVHAAESKSGRVIKGLEAREQRLKDAETKAEARQKEKDESEIEAAEGDKDEQSRIKRRQALRVGELTLKQEREEFEKGKSANQAKIAKAEAAELSTDISEIATKHEVDAGKLKALAEKLGITDLEQVEELAKATSAKEASGPDNGRTMGGGVDWRKLPPGDKVRLGLDKKS